MQTITPLQIENELKKLPYLFQIRQVKEGWDSPEVTIGWIAHSSSVLRKTTTLNRLTNFIKNQKLPLEIVDEETHHTRFTILIKNEMP